MRRKTDPDTAVELEQSESATTPAAPNGAVELERALGAVDELVTQRAQVRKGIDALRREIGVAREGLRASLTEIGEGEANGIVSGRVYVPPAGVVSRATEARTLIAAKEEAIGSLQRRLADEIEPKIPAAVDRLARCRRLQVAAMCEHLETSYTEAARAFLAVWRHAVAFAVGSGHDEALTRLRGVRIVSLTTGRDLWPGNVSAGVFCERVGGELRTAWAGDEQAEQLFRESEDMRRKVDMLQQMANEISVRQAGPAAPVTASIDMGPRTQW